MTLRNPEGRPSGRSVSGTVVYVITCGLCGQSWQRTVATDGQIIECVFCGSVGRLRVGASQPDWEGIQRVEVWLSVGQRIGADDHTQRR